MLVEKFGMHLTKRCYRKSSGQKILYHIEQEVKAPTFCCFILFHLSYSFPAESTKHSLVFTPSSMPRLAFLCYSLDTKCPTPSRVLCRELGPQLLSLLWKTPEVGLSRNSRLLLQVVLRVFCLRLLVWLPVSWLPPAGACDVTMLFLNSLHYPQYQVRVHQSAETVSQRSCHCLRSTGFNYL